MAPTILESEIDNWFIRPKNGALSDKWMLFSYKVKPEKIGEIPAVTHFDYSGRVQVVSSSTNNELYTLIQKFYDKTGVPILVNTSFNIQQPIVNTPEEAIRNFLIDGKSKIDFLIMNNILVSRKNDYNLELLSRLQLSFQTISEHLR